MSCRVRSCCQLIRKGGDTLWAGLANGDRAWLRENQVDDFTRNPFANLIRIALRHRFKIGRPCQPKFPLACPKSLKTSNYGAFGTGGHPGQAGCKESLICWRRSRDGQQLPECCKHAQINPPLILARQNSTSAQPPNQCRATGATVDLAHNICQLMQKVFDPVLSVKHLALECLA